MPMEANYKGKIFNISVDHEVILPEVEMDNSILGSDTEAYAICLKKRAKVPFTEDYVEFEYVEDYALKVEDLDDLVDGEYAVKTTLGQLLTRLKKEDSII